MTADVGLTGATPNNLIYVAGEPDHKVSNTDFIDHLEQVIRQRAAVLEQQQADIDVRLAQRFHADGFNGYTRPRDFHPLPLLGIPGGASGTRGNS